MELKNRITHIDCFAGAGGIATGLAAAGFETLIAIDCIKSCCDTYSTNHPTVRVIHSDIRDVQAGDILPFIPAEGVDLVTSGMPCETFSTAGNKSRSFYDDRQFLFREGLRIATLANAKMILFENVPAITSKTVSKDDDTLIIDVLKKELVEAGYANYIEVVLDATKFGVPQRRNRYFILAAKEKTWRLTEPVPTCQQPITVQEAMCDLPNVEPNSKVDAKIYTGTESDYTRLMKDTRFWNRENFAEGLTLQTAMKHRPSTVKRFSLLREGEGLKELFERFTDGERLALQQERVLPKKMFIKRNVRLKWNESSSTVTSHCLDEFVHPIYDRALTVRECARLQSFPDSYFFAGPFLVPHLDKTTQDKYEQIGDAVPPLLAYAWGGAIKKILEAMTDDPVFDYCKTVYEQTYATEYDKLSNGKKKRQPIKENAERHAQKQAIREALKNSVDQFDTEDIATIWKNVYKVHIFRKSGLQVDEETVAKVISADQSWRKSSGHAFEELVKEIANCTLAGSEVEIVLQKDLNLLIKAGAIANEPRDIAWLELQIANAIFDLYAIVTVDGQKFCFGCIQSKTSIRDRVTRDREPSIHAMESFFWSVCIALDGEFLKLPKFRNMVNGGNDEDEFRVNGWHGMYVLSEIVPEDRIYHTDFNFDIFTSHAKEAAAYWLQQRQWLDPKWRATKK